MNEEAQIADICSDDAKFKSFVAMSIMSHGRKLEENGKKLEEIELNCKKQICAAKIPEGIMISPGMSKRMAAAMIAGFYAMLEAIKATVLALVSGLPNGNNQ